ncbi:MAG: SHOCT domain-containing protein [Acidobacteriota bacterium]|jgi:activator of 2-hydroxyglutaryl-CoA dehydratase|nr:SHOCT domain-containing protein [Acidobacteriota bacterium]
MNDILGSVLIFILLVVLGFFLNRHQQNEIKNRKDKIKNRKETLVKAQKAYKTELSKLKSNSNNADLKENVLRLGREYSGYTRKFQGIDGISVVDEVAIMNDINAACANFVSFQDKSHQSVENTIEQRLKNLSELKAKNLINEQEFNERRDKILNEI